MATIQPLQIPEYSAAAPSSFDFAPLAQMIQQRQQQQQQPQGLAALAPQEQPGMPASMARQAAVPYTSGAGKYGGGGGDYAGAISRIESGGNYSELGPVTKSGDRAYGKYQVMGANVPEWSRAALGRSVTPQEFLANPQLQDTIFKHRFGQYVDKYGPGGAARAWFAGEGGMNNPNAKDQLGTSVAGYERRFLGGL
jgi:hypothetical protein